jgi:hypothetical protein
MFDHPDFVVLTSGERLVCDTKTPEGILTDAGLISWEDVLGLLTWWEDLGMYVSIPQQ